MEPAGGSQDAANHRHSDAEREKVSAAGVGMPDQEMGVSVSG